MMNQVIFTGRLTKDPEVKELENGKKVSNICVAVQRQYKNDKGKYDVDFFDCSLWNEFAENTNEYCKKGDIIGVKGHLASTQDKDGKNVLNIVIEKITFIAKKKEENIDKEIDNDKENIKI